MTPTCASARVTTGLGREPAEARTAAVALDGEILVPGNYGQERGAAAPSGRARPVKILMPIRPRSAPPRSHPPVSMARHVAGMTFAGQAVGNGVEPRCIVAAEVADGGAGGIDPDRIWVVLVGRARGPVPP